MFIKFVLYTKKLHFFAQFFTFSKKKALPLQRF